MPDSQTRELRLMVTVGTRPEAIKLAPVIMELERRRGVRTIVCATGQHREMLDQAFALFGIRPHLDLDLMMRGQTPSQVASRVLAAMEATFARERPDWVIVQGDTTTAMATAVCAFYAGVRVAHVEAGLRTYDLRRPFPEEANRRIVSHVADLNFAPTERARANLEREGIAPKSIKVTGNTVIDALYYIARQPVGPNTRQILNVVGVNTERPEHRLILVTAHRRESFGAGFEGICRALTKLAAHYGPRIRIVYPVHPNPEVAGPAKRMLGGIDNLHLIDPVDYRTLVALLQKAYVVLTDSGGIQEEAPAFGVPVLVMRDATERPEGLEAGVARLIGVCEEKIVDAVKTVLDVEGERDRMSLGFSPYGDGRAAKRIVEWLTEEGIPSKQGASGSVNDKASRVFDK